MENPDVEMNHPDEEYKNPIITTEIDENESDIDSEGEPRDDSINNQQV